MGRSSRLKRPGIAWMTLIQTVDCGEKRFWMASIRRGKAWPVEEGQGRAWERTFKVLPSRVAESRIDTFLGSFVSKDVHRWIYR